MTIQRVTAWGGGFSFLKINGSPNLPCVVTDDDMASAPTAVPVNAIVNDRFADAYVRCLADGAGAADNNDNNIAFVLNGPLSSLSAGGGILESEPNKSPEYWCSYVLVAFQGPAAPDSSTPPRADGDPDSEIPLGGSYVGQILLYDEDLREDSVKYSLDLSPYRERVLTHELGHAFGAPDGVAEGGIMYALDINARFTEKTLDRIRDTTTSP